MNEKKNVIKYMCVSKFTCAFFTERLSSTAYFIDKSNLWMDDSYLSMEHGSLLSIVNLMLISALL